MAAEEAGESAIASGDVRGGEEAGGPKDTPYQTRRRCTAPFGWELDVAKRASWAMRSGGARMVEEAVEEMDILRLGLRLLPAEDRGFEPSTSWEGIEGMGVRKCGP
jgi:hypothetical protein